MKPTFTLLSLLLAASVSNVFATSGDVLHNSDPLVKTFISNIKRMPDANYQYELSQSAAWQNYIQQNGNWMVWFNEENQKPHRATGTSIPVVNMGTPEGTALNFMQNYLSNFNIPVSDLHLRNAPVSNKHQYVNFYQTYNGLEVLWSNATVKMTLNNQVILWGLDVYNDIQMSTTPALNSQAAVVSATNGIVTNITSTVVNPSLKVLPVPAYRKNNYHLVYEVTVETVDADNVPAIYYTLVDANNGEVLYRHNNVSHANTDVNVSANVYTSNSYNPSTVVPLKNLQIITSSVDYTDSVGYFGYGFTSSTNATLKLQGLWSNVNTNGVTPTMTATLNPGTNNISFDNDATIQELTAFYSVNIVHDYHKIFFPSFTGLDNPLMTNVDLTTGTCNAFYSGTSINFYAADAQCTPSATIPDVCYHEYGHGINDKFYQSIGGNFGNGAMNEGYADTWALGITVSPILGQGFYQGNATGFIRRYDINKKVYPQDLQGEVHADGEIIAGCWWDVGENFNDHQQMMGLYSQTFYATLTAPDGQEGTLYHDVLIEALTDDDNDGNLANGTPHYCQITSAFAIHGITVSGTSSTINHTEILSSAAMAPVVVNATVPNIAVGTTVNGYYKVNGAGSWSPFTLNNTGGNNFSGIIPAQPNGTIVSYYMDMIDNCNTHTGSLPAHVDNPDPNIPFYVLIGFNLMSSDNFEITSTQAWQAGAPGDLATTGMWEIAQPIASYLNGNTGMVQTNLDYSSTNDNWCAITQNASPGDPAGTADVDGGKTTLISDVYNLSSYTDPAFTYWRWYSNDQGATPGTDFWQTFISNDGVNYVAVENTDVSDHSWRRYAFRVADYITPSATVYLKFVAEDANAGSLIEAGVDDVELWDAIPTALNENNTINALSVFPNPAHDLITIRWAQMKSESVSISMTDNVGRVVYSADNNFTTGPNKVSVKTDNLSNGVYFLKLQSAGSTITKKITVLN